jgi:uncharacterized protein YdaU (DUF1376 family)
MRLSAAPGSQFSSATLMPVAEHSAKPEFFLEMIEQYFPTLPKIELNRRGPERPDWKAWGNESELPPHDPETGEIIETVAPAPAAHVDRADDGLEIPKFLRRPDCTGGDYAMGNIRWYKRDPSAALTGMPNLTLEECGAYNIILDLIYDRGGAIDDDDRFIAGWLRVHVRVWRRLRRRLIELDKIYVNGPTLRNARADREVEAAQNRIRKAAPLNVRLNYLQPQRKSLLISLTQRTRARAGEMRRSSRRARKSKSRRTSSHAQSSRKDSPESEQPRTSPMTSAMRSSAWRRLMHSMKARSSAS